MSKIKLVRAREITDANGSTTLVYTDVRLPGLSRNAANILRVIGAFALLMGVLFGGAYTLHVITLDHWAAFPVIEAMVLLICACLALLVFAGSKLTDEWGRK